MMRWHGLSQSKRSGTSLGPRKIVHKTVDIKPLPNVLPILEDWLQRNQVAVWASWGKSMRGISRQSALSTLDNPFSAIKHYNLNNSMRENLASGWG